MSFRNSISLQLGNSQDQQILDLAHQRYLLHFRSYDNMIRTGSINRENFVKGIFVEVNEIGYIYFKREMNNSL